MIDSECMACYDRCCIEYGHLAHVRSKAVSRVEEMIKGLPPELQREVEDFVALLMEKQRHERGGHMKLGWRGALQGIRGQYTSVELQHEALRGRGE